MPTLSTINLATRKVWKLFVFYIFIHFPGPLHHQKKNIQIILKAGCCWEGIPMKYCLKQDIQVLNAEPQSDFPLKLQQYGDTTPVDLMMVTVLKDILRGQRDESMVASENYGSTIKCRVLVHPSAFFQWKGWYGCCLQIITCGLVRNRTYWQLALTVALELLYIESWSMRVFHDGRKVMTNMNYLRDNLGWVSRSLQGEAWPLTGDRWNHHLV